MRNRVQRRTTTALGVSAAALLVLVSCGGDTAEMDAPDAGSAPTVTSDEETTPEEPEPTDEETGTDEPDELEEPEETEDEGGLPPGGTGRMEDADFDESIHGEEFELYFSGEGAEVGVAGIALDDPLEVRAEPYSEAEIVAELDSLDAVLLGGRERSHIDTEDEGIWTEIELADGYGWISGHIYYFGSTEDSTENYADLGTFDDAQEAAEAVLDQATDFDEGEPSPDWTMITAPEDLDEEFFRGDVTGAPDDSVAGARYFIHVEEADGGYEVVQVETTSLCRRGVSDDGLCI